MSLKGITKFAKVMSYMQTARGELLGMKTKQDLRLGQLLYEMKELVKVRFAKETLKVDEVKYHER